MADDYQGGSGVDSGSSQPSAQGQSSAPASTPSSPPSSSSHSSSQPSGGYSSPDTSRTPQSNNQLLTAFRGYGHDVSNFQDDHSLMDAMGKQFGQIPSLQQQINQYKQALEKYQQQPQEPVSAPVESKPRPSAWNPPQNDGKWDQMMTFDRELGQWTPLPQYAALVPFSAVQSKNEDHKYRSDWANQFREHPGKAMSPLVKEDLISALSGDDDDLGQAIRDIISKELDTRVGRHKVHTETSNFVNEFAPWAFVDGVVDDTGDPSKLTPIGHMMLAAADQADKYGISDPGHRRDFVKQSVAFKLSQMSFQQQSVMQQSGQQSAAPSGPPRGRDASGRFLPQQVAGGFGGAPDAGFLTPEQTNEQMKRRFSGGVGHSASANNPATFGQIPVPDPGNGRVVSLAEIALPEHQRRGFV